MFFLITNCFFFEWAYSFHWVSDDVDVSWRPEGAVFFKVDEAVVPNPGARALLGVDLAHKVCDHFRRFHQIFDLERKMK